MNYKENRELWVARVASFRKSGMNQYQWCKVNEIKPPAPRYWLRKLNSRDNFDEEVGSFEFVSLRVSSASAAKSITLEVGAARIHLNIDFDEKLLLKVIRTLQQL